MTTSATADRPGLPSGPVVLIHAEDPPGSGLAACCGEPFQTPSSDEYVTVGRVQCPGCLIRFREPKRRPPQQGDRVRVVFEGTLANPDYPGDFEMNQYRLADGRTFSRDHTAIEILARHSEETPQP